VISGSDVVTGWVQHSGNIWRAPLTSGAKHVYVNGVRQTLARFPNTGWLRNDQGTGTTLYDNALTQGSGYWNGSTVVIRSTNWSYDAPTVSGFSNGTLTFPNIYYNLGSNDWGYFLCNKLSELDAPGEWYHDATNGQLYLWAPNNANPNTLTVEAAIRDRGINVYWSRQFVTIADLAFQHQRLAGVWLDGASNVTITGCTFRELYFGIRSVGTNCLYQGNTFHDTYATAAMMLDNGSQFHEQHTHQHRHGARLGRKQLGLFRGTYRWEQQHRSPEPHRERGLHRHRGGQERAGGKECGAEPYRHPQRWGGDRL
jgi:parallel beta-helix repeat protein